MRPRDLPKALVERVGKHDLLRYALSNGWVQERVIPQRFVVLEVPGSDVDQLLIPENPNADDYSDRVSETIVQIAERCNRDPMHILNALLFVPADVLRFNVAGYDMSRGDLSFDQATRMMQGIRRSIMSAACSVVKPQGFHPRLERREADQLLKGCRLRQTEAGSFTFVLACPIDAVDSADDVPFVRRATGLFMRSVSWLASTVDSGRADHAMAEITQQQSLSANLCDGLLDMQPDDDQATLSIGAEWEWRYGLSAEYADIGTIRLHREHFAFVSEVGRRLRPKQEDQKPHLHVGRVEALHGVPDETGVMQGEAVLTLFAEEETLKHVQTDLEPNAYAEAVDAHKANRLVSLQGILRRGRRSHRIDEVTEFRTLEERAPSGR